MQIMKFAVGDDPTPFIGVVEGEGVFPVGRGEGSLSELLHSGDLAGKVRALVADKKPVLSVRSVRVLAPLDRQEVWGAGVTYERSKVAREQESDGRPRFTTWFTGRTGLSFFSRRRPAGLSARGSRFEFGAIRAGVFPSRSWHWY